MALNEADIKIIKAKAQATLKAKDGWITFQPNAKDSPSYWINFKTFKEIFKLK